ncbi:SGNH hydrolase domain-containing protein [Sphingomonas qilianensis]|uniref:SGNH hydrolase domain-containing protein n=1 Tax=Sphingomonas qilianensis TaxID=1736690 RepID=UPI003610613C
MEFSPDSRPRRIRCSSASVVSSVQEFGTTHRDSRPPPGARLAVPDAMARAAAFGRSIDLRQTPTGLASLRETNRFLAEQASANGYAFVDLYTDLCRNGCNPMINGQPLYFDGGHMRATTSRQVSRKFENILLPK